MQQTVSRLISAATRLIGVKATGNQLSGEQANNALYTLNEIGDYLNADGDMIYAIQQVTAPLNTGTVVQPNGITTYTIGPGLNNGGNTATTFDVAQRPEDITFASFQLTIGQSLDMPIKLVSAEEWQSIRVKNIPSTISYYLYYDLQWPVANIYLWPQPSVQANLVLMFWQPLPSTLTMSSILNLPPGYARLLRYELAVNLAPEFGKGSDDPRVMFCLSALANIKKQLKIKNKRHTELTYSNMAQGWRGTGIYDIFTDEVY